MARQRTRVTIGLIGVVVLLVGVLSVVDLSAVEIEPTQCELENGPAKLGCCAEEMQNCLRNCAGNSACQNHCGNRFNGCMGRPSVPD